MKHPLTSLAEAGSGVIIVSASLLLYRAIRSTAPSCYVSRVAGQHLRPVRMRGRFSFAGSRLEQRQICRGRSTGQAAYDARIATVIRQFG